MIGTPELGGLPSGIRVPWDRVVPPYPHHEPEDAITASATQSQGQQPLTKIAHRVSTVGVASDVVTLPPAQAGRPCLVRNDGANTLQIFPASGDAINGGATDASITLAAGAALVLVAMTDDDWYTFGSA